MSNFTCLRCEAPTASEVWGCPNCDRTLCACGNAKYSARAARCGDCAARKAAELLSGEFTDYTAPEPAIVICRDCDAALATVGEKMAGRCESCQLRRAQDVLPGEYAGRVNLIVTSPPDARDAAVI